MQSDRNTLNLSDRNIVILGGTGHLGSAFSLGMLNSGAKILAIGRNLSKLEMLVQEANSTRNNLHIARCDIHDYNNIENSVIDFESKVGPINGLVNNAYQFNGSPVFLESTEQDITTSLKYLTSTIVNTQFIAKKMISDGINGSIVNIASMYGLVSPKPYIYKDFTEYGNPPIYGAIKAGIIQFTKYAAIHLASKKIRVNSISPGAFPALTSINTKFIARLEKEIPLQRIGTPDELVFGLIYLLSDLSQYVTGTNLVIDGGWTSW